MSRRLLTATALVEIGTGVVLLVVPSLVVELLLGEGLCCLNRWFLGGLLVLRDPPALCVGWPAAAS